MKGCLGIVLILIGLVGGVIGFGPSCYVYEGIAPVCLGSGKYVGLVVAAVAGAGAVAVALARRRR